MNQRQQWGIPFEYMVNDDDDLQVVHSVGRGESHVTDDVRRIVGDPAYVPVDARELCHRLFITCYMGSANSSAETRQRAADLAGQVPSMQPFFPLLLLFFFSASNESNARVVSFFSECADRQLPPDAEHRRGRVGRAEDLRNGDGPGAQVPRRRRQPAREPRPAERPGPPPHGTAPGTGFTGFYLVIPSFVRSLGDLDRVSLGTTRTELGPRWLYRVLLFFSWVKRVFT